MKDNEMDEYMIKQPMSETTMNRYVCEVCKGNIVTINREQGVTPFMLKCRARNNCKGWMLSGFYREFITKMPSYEWRKPTEEEYKALHPEMKEHVDKGGLMIYKIIYREEQHPFDRIEE